MPLTQAYSIDGVNISTTEISVVSGTVTLQSITVAGLYQLFIDGPASGLAIADRFIVRVKEKVLGTATQKAVMSPMIEGPQSSPLVLPMLALLNGWDMTIQKLAGADRLFYASIRKVSE